MRYNDMQERRSVISFLAECSDEQVVSLLSFARKGAHEKDNYGNTVVYFENEDDSDEEE